MKKLVVAAISLFFIANSAFAQSCEEKAVGKTGKALAGAAKTAFMKKCEKDTPPPVAADGKSAQQNKMKTCNAEAKGKTGDDRKAFMKACLSS